MKPSRCLCSAFCLLLILPCLAHAAGRPLGLSSLTSGTLEDDEQRLVEKKKVRCTAIFAEGQNDFYNGRFEKASREFDGYISCAPDDSVGYWRKSYNWYFRLRSAQKTDFPKVDEKTRESFFSIIATGTEKANAKIAANEDRDFHLYVKACLISIRGGLEFKNTSWLKARKTLKEVIAVASQSNYPDAKYLIGLTNYRGAEHSMLFFFAGLPHDRERGLEYIFDSVLMNDGPFVDDIWLAIFKIKTDKNVKISSKNAERFNRDQTEKIFLRLYSKYPDNTALQSYLKNRPTK